MDPGSQLGPYEIKEPLGKGGMGEVYRAWDTNLRRDVAIKLLPPELATDSKRLGRLKREARSLAALNHPHIATVHGFEEQDGTSFIVMELVEGETLAEKLADGPLPIDEALEFAIQIARALEAAHDRRIVHRDLKPANVKVTPSGEVKVLDFGLAKPLRTGVEEAETQAPTATVEATRTGAVMGTAPYMSPEQARGDEVDPQADIWALGCLLYEMLSGERAFAADTSSDTLAAVLTRDPEWSVLPAETPVLADAVLRRCLNKDPHRRLHHPADARIELEEALLQKDDPTRSAYRSASAGPVSLLGPFWVLGAIALLVIVAAMVWSWSPASTREAGATAGRRAAFELAVPALDWNATDTGIAVSPSGEIVAYMNESATGGPPVLWLRELDDVEPVRVPGTEGAGNLFWSPDGNRVGYVKDNVIRVVDPEGGPTQTIASTVAGTIGPPSWTQDGRILYSSGTVAGGFQIMSVSESGGDPVGLTHPDEEIGHVFPESLANGKRFLYLDIQQRADQANVLYMHSFDGNGAVRIEGVHSRAQFAAGHLFYWDQGSLIARRFDPASASFTGHPMTIGDMTGAFFARTGMADFSVARNGAVLAYGSMVRNLDLKWFDATGRDLGTLSEQGRFGDFRIAPGGNRVAMEVEDRSTGTRDISIFDVQRGLVARSLGGPGDQTDPAWSPDGQRLAYTDDLEGPPRVFIRRADGSGEPMLVPTPEKRPAYVNDWSADGEHIAYVTWTQDSNLHAVSLSGAELSWTLAGGPGDQGGARFSPDNRWLAFSSEEPGRREIFVTELHGDSVPKRVSSDGGRHPAWHPEGEKLYYVNGSSLYAVRFSPQTGDIGSAREQFSVGAARDIVGIDVSSDGERFLVAVGDRGRSGATITILLNWHVTGE